MLRQCGENFFIPGGCPRRARVWGGAPGGIRTSTPQTIAVRNIRTSDQVITIIHPGTAALEAIGAFAGHLFQARDLGGR